ncbi:hypothetical protein K449DRAFT_400483 [Hypoxylon sp. EC38]|nr:hypothetical protein K449DRAFT_400483 [Hypoxylon sp. EC38]
MVGCQDITIKYKHTITSDPAIYLQAFVDHDACAVKVNQDAVPFFGSRPVPDGVMLRGPVPIGPDSRVLSSTAKLLGLDAGRIRLDTRVPYYRMYDPPHRLKGHVKVDNLAVELYYL